MGFRNGSYIKIWEVEDKGKYSLATISISRKNKETNAYETEFQEKFVKLVSSAHKAVQGVEIPKSGLSAQIKACDVTNTYNAEKKQKYYNFVIFEMDSDNNSTVVNTAPASTTTDDTDDEELPF